MLNFQLLLSLSAVLHVSAYLMLEFGEQFGLLTTSLGNGYTYILALDLRSSV